MGYPEPSGRTVNYWMLLVVTFSVFLPLLTLTGGQTVTSCGSGGRVVACNRQRLWLGGFCLGLLAIASVSNALGADPGGGNPAGGNATAKRIVRPRFLGGPDAEPRGDRRRQLAEWMTSARNPYLPGPRSIARGDSCSGR